MHSRITVAENANMSYAYCGVYLQEEIQAEGLSRRMESESELFGGLFEYLVLNENESSDLSKNNSGSYNWSYESVLFIIFF